MSGIIENKSGFSPDLINEEDDKASSRVTVVNQEEISAMLLVTLSDITNLLATLSTELRLLNARVEEAFETKLGAGDI